MGLNYKGTTFHGSTCSCCVADAAPGTSSVDPTGTAKLRRRWRATLRLRWQALRKLTKQMLVTQDLLALTAKGALSASNPAIAQGATKIQSFQRFIDWALMQAVTGADVSLIRPMLATAYDDGASFARSMIRQPVQYPHTRDRVDSLTQLAYVELQGIAEAVSQQATREVAKALLHNATPLSVMRTVATIIDKVGVSRTNAMIELMVIKAFGEATLDVYAAAGVIEVNLVPEIKRDAQITDARRRGPGSNSSRTTTPSRSTIYRIRRAQRELEKLKLVNVLTAGDNKVCKICEAISENGPYKIDTARSLIPAHPNCRCVFVPANDRRYAPITF